MNYNHSGIIFPSMPANPELEALVVLAQAALDNLRAEEIFEANFNRLADLL